MLGQVLVDEEMLTYEKYENLLKEYKADSGFSDKEIEVLKSNNTNHIIKIFFQGDNTAESLLFQEYIELFVRNLVRFIDNEVIIEKPFLTESFEYNILSQQLIHGDYEVITGLDMDADTMLKFASIYAKDDFIEVDEDVTDALGEFINCQNGLFISNLYHKNINCDLEPQVTIKKDTLKAKNSLFILPCNLNIGKINIVFNV
jgi:CheY-specific phosphatase CheX